MNNIINYLYNCIVFYVLNMIGTNITFWDKKRVAEGDNFSGPGKYHIRNISIRKRNFVNTLTPILVEHELKGAIW